MRCKGTCGACMHARSGREFVASPSTPSINHPKNMEYTHCGISYSMANRLYRGVGGCSIELRGLKHKRIPYLGFVWRMLAPTAGFQSKTQLRAPILLRTYVDSMLVGMDSPNPKPPDLNPFLAPRHPRQGDTSAAVGVAVQSPYSRKFHN